MAFGFGFRFLLTLAVATLSFANAHAQTSIFSGSAADGNALGLRIFYDDWSDQDSDYADSTYRSFKAYKKLQQKTLGRYDFYYRLKIRVPSKLISTSVDCKASPFFKALLQEVFSTSTANLVVVNSNVRYQPSIGSNIDLISDKAPILMFSQGAKPDVLGAGNGCFLKQVSSADFPPIRYENGNPSDGKDSFAVSFDIKVGTQLNTEAVSRALSLFTAATSVVFPWSAAAGTAVTTSLNNALSSAGTFQTQSPASKILKQRSKIYFRIPGAFQANLIEIFPYLSASLILPLRDGSPSSVLASSDLKVRSCSFQNISAANCAAKPIVITLRGGDFVRLVNLPANYVMPENLLDPESHPELTFPLCQAIRSELDQVLQLSTIDQMLVRWALTKLSGMQSALKDPVKSEKIVAAIKPNYPAITLQAVKDACWNAGDDEILLGKVAPDLKNQ